MTIDATPRNIAHLTGRRRLLAGLGALPLVGAAGATAMPARAAEPARTQARIVIAGGGAAGLTAASRLAALLDGAHITVIDGRKAHYYQPGFTLIAAGVKPQGYVISSTSEYIPKGVELIAEKVAEIDPEGKAVVTDSGKRLAYDFLILATGLELNYGAIEGMDTTRIGTNGLGSIYHSPQAAAATWQALNQFADTGGVGLFGRPLGEMKCAGAPLKYTFISDDHLRRRGNRGKAELMYMAQSKSLFGVPIVAEKVRMLFQDRGVKVHHEHVLQSIDPDRRIAIYKTPAGTLEQGYDFINVVPTHARTRGGTQQPAALDRGALGGRRLGRGGPADAASQALPRSVRGGRHRRCAQRQDRREREVAGARGRLSSRGRHHRQALGRHVQRLHQLPAHHAPGPRHADRVRLPGQPGDVVPRRDRTTGGVVDQLGDENHGPQANLYQHAARSRLKQGVGP